MWRPEDDALLQRIEDELVIDALWRRETGGAQPLHPRAAGLVAILRAVPGGAVVVEEAGRVLTAQPGAPLPDPGGLSMLLRPTSMGGLPGDLLHHLAIFHERVAGATSADVAFGARLRALAAWFAMTHDEGYLTTLIEGTLGDVSEDDLRAHRTLAMRRPLDELGRVARSGARDLDASSHAALRSLAATEHAARLADLSSAQTRPLVLHAERLRAGAIDAALTPMANAVAELVARNAHESEAPAVMEQVVEVWRWSGWDEHVERFAVDEVTPVAWTIYQRQASYAHLRRLIAPLVPLVERLAQRIAEDPTAIAYAAPVAQMYVFRSEMTSDFDERVRLAERAVAACPSHRNGRYILASLMCTDVRRKLDRGFWMMGARTDLERKLDRAAELNPDAKGLAGLRERLASLGGWVR